MTEPTELWRVRSVIRKRAVTDPVEVVHHVIALEDEVLALREQVERAVARAEGAERRVAELLQAENTRFRESMMWKERAIESGWGQ